MAVYLCIDDVRAMLKLVAEAREILDAGACARSHVLQGLARLAGAAVGIAMNMDLRRDAPAKVTGYLDHGWTAGERGQILSYYGSTAGMHDPMIDSYMRARWRLPHVTLRRGDLVDNKTWYSSTLHNELHRPGRLDDVLLSVRPDQGAAGGVSALVFKRAAGDRPFSVEERELVHLFRSESDWIFRAECAPQRHLADGLTRREQEALGMLLTDASEKEIAARLGISPHTAHDHIKRLYRKVGVSSRAALMALAFAGDRAPGGEGGARPASSPPRLAARR